MGEVIALTTGTAGHSAVENRSRNPEKPQDEIVKEILATYQDSVKDGFLHIQDEDVASYVKAEQGALIEALFRAWDLREREKLDQRFETLSIEEEYECPLDKNGDLVLLSRPDRVLQDKQTGDIYTYSLKIVKSWYDRMEQSYKVDLQGFTEALAVTVATGMKVMGTKFCFLIKGKRYKKVETRMDGVEAREIETYVTDSPLIYGYRKLKENGKYEYAHTNKVVKVQNISGFGKLGKDWSRFRVWEAGAMAIKKWINYLSQGIIQPELGDVVKAHVVTPVEVHRTREHLKSTYVQIQSAEQQAFKSYEEFENGKSVDACFPMNRRACYWPEPCWYLPICPNGSPDYSPRIAENPIRSGEFILRVSHYEKERKALSAVTSGSKA